MFKQVEVYLTTKKAIQLMTALHQCNTDDDLLDHVFTMGSKSLLLVKEKFDDDVKTAVIKYATEKDEILLKKSGEYEYSKANQQALENEIIRLGNEPITVKLLQVDVSKRKRALKKINRILKSILIDTVLVNENPVFTEEEPEEKK